LEVSLFQVFKFWSEKQGLNKDLIKNKHGRSVEDAKIILMHGAKKIIIPRFGSYDKLSNETQK
jgi:hypothetical protein